jgi:uncharacterized protein (DUF433 family)
MRFVCILSNRLVVKGFHVRVESILDLAEDGYGPDRIARSYPSLTLANVERVLACHRATPAA